MKRRVALLALAAAAAAVPAPAHAHGHAHVGTRAVCSLSFDISFDRLGRFSTRAGQHHCAGHVGGRRLSPLGTTGRIRGSAQRVPGTCVPRFGQGALSMRLPRLVDLGPGAPIRLAAFWGAWSRYTSAASRGAGIFSGRGKTEGRPIDMLGAWRFVPAGPCGGAGLSPGRLVIDVRIGNRE